MPNARPWVSSKDISGGDIWFNVIQENLRVKLGIVLITPENQNEPWLNFEAGALLGGVKKRSCLVPVLLGFPEDKTLDSRHPLTSLNQVHGTEANFRTLFLDIAAEVGDTRVKEDLSIAFQKMWETNLAEAIAALSVPKKVKLPKAPVDATDALDEMRQALRDIKIELQHVRNDRVEPRNLSYKDFSAVSLPYTVGPDNKVTVYGNFSNQIPSVSEEIKGGFGSDTVVRLPASLGTFSINGPAFPVAPANAPQKDRSDGDDSNGRRKPKAPSK